MPLISRKVRDPTIDRLTRKRDVAGLTDLLNHDRSSVRRAKAATALGVIGNREAARALDLARHDRDKDVREAATAALERMGASSFLKQNRDVKVLINALNHKEVAMRRDAAKTLGEIGDDRAIIPLVRCVLTSIASDKEIEEVRRAAGRALSSIGPHAVAPLVEALDIANDSFKVRGVYKDAIASTKKQWARNPHLLVISAAAATLGELEWEPATERLSRLRGQLAGLAATDRDLSLAHSRVTYALKQIRQARTSRRDEALQRFASKLRTFMANAQPSGDEAAQLLAELYDGSAHPGGGFVKGEAPGEQVRQVGQRLYESGGHEAMLDAHALFAALRPGMARNLEMVWDGVGAWSG
jgi:HEAT repeat protein